MEKLPEWQSWSWFPKVQQVSRVVDGWADWNCTQGSLARGELSSEYTCKSNWNIRYSNSNDRNDLGSIQIDKPITYSNMTEQQTQAQFQKFKSYCEDSWNTTGRDALTARFPGFKFDWDLGLTLGVAAVGLCVIAMVQQSLVTKNKDGVTLSPAQRLWNYVFGSKE